MARILLITHICPPAIDGGSQVIHKVGDYLRKLGHEVATLSTNASSTDDFTHAYKSRHCEEHSDAAIPSIRLPVYTIFHRPLKLISRFFPLFKVFAIGPIFKLIPFLRFLHFYLKFKPDYIIAGPLPTTIVLYAQFLRFISRVLAHQRTMLLINASFHASDRDFHNPLLTKSLQCSDYLWTLTDYETNYFHKNFDIPLSRMINVGNGVDKSLLSSEASHQRTRGLSLLYLGSFSAHKGIETIIDAFVLLSSEPAHQRTTLPTLTLAGQPTLHSSAIEKKIYSLPLKTRSRIKIVYNFKSSNLANFLDKCTVLVSASSQESFGLVLLEAMARGVLVVGADIPATSELINNSGAGIIFKTDDPVDLALKINKIQSTKALVHKFSIKGLSYATSHTWDRIGEKLWQKISSS